MFNNISIAAFIAGSGWLASGGFEWVIRQNDKIANLIISAGEAGGVAADYSTFGVAFACGMLLQAGVVRSWRGAFDNGLISANTLLAAGMSLVSMVSSSGNALLSFKHNELTTLKLMAAAEPTIDEAEAAIAMVTALSGSANDMSRRSNGRAAVEDQTGGSCINVAAKKGKGANWRMRTRHQADAATISTGLRSLADELDDLLIAFATGTDDPQARARTLQKSVQNALRDNKVSALLNRAQVLETDMAIGWTDVNPKLPEGDANRETQRSCTDPEYTAALQAFVGQFRQVMSTRLSAVIVDDTGLDDGFAQVFADTGAYLQGGPTGPGAGAMGFSLAVELLQVLAVYLAFKEDRRAGRVLNKRDRPFEPGTPLSRTGRKRKARIVARIQACLVNYRGQSYFACPNPRSLADAQVLDVLCKRGGKLEVAGVPSDVMNIDGWLDARPNTFARMASFDLYSVPEGIFDDILELSDADLDAASKGATPRGTGPAMEVPAE